MNSQLATARRIGIGALAACSLLLTSCAAGQHAATARQIPPIDGTNGSVGQIDLRGVSIVAPAEGTAHKAGSDAAVTVVIVNNGTAADTLTGVTTEAAANWAVFANQADASAAASAAAPSTSESASGSASASSSESGSGSASASAPAKSPSGVATLPVGVTSVDIPGSSSVSFGMPSSKGALLLLDLKGQLFPAQSVPVTFTFKNAGEVTLQVPVQLSATPASSTVPAPSGTEGEHAVKE